MVDPPIAPLTLIAFSNDCFVTIFDITKFSLTISTILFPDRYAFEYLLESTAGIAALWGSAIPRASTILAIVEAVPIVIQ